MVPAEQADYSAYNTLGKILEDYRIRDTKYSGPRQKRVKISLGLGNIYHASAGFLQSLRDKYGSDTTFNDALAQWGVDK